MTLRKAIIKLAHDNPGEVRDALLPLLSKQAETPSEVTAWVAKGIRLIKNLQKDPNMKSESKLLANVRQIILQLEDRLETKAILDRRTPLSRSERWPGGVINR